MEIERKKHLVIDVELNLNKNSQKPQKLNENIFMNQLTNKG
mgnify:CR=1 FL=1